MKIRIENTSTGNVREIDSLPATVKPAFAAIALVHPNNQVAAFASQALTWAENNPAGHRTDTFGNFIITIDNRTFSSVVIEPPPGRIFLARDIVPVTITPTEP